jgi:hypothetical protein
VAHAFDEERPRLLALPLHPFHTDRIEQVRSRKTIYVRFDLNGYSIPPEAVGRSLTLLASENDVRILDGAAEIARHHRSYDRQQSILDPAHEQALLRTKRKALHQTRAGRLALAVPESETLLERAFAAGESAASQTSQLLRLLDLYGVAALRRAVREALERNTPRASSGKTDLKSRFCENEKHRPKLGKAAPTTLVQQSRKAAAPRPRRLGTAIVKPSCMRRRRGRRLRKPGSCATQPEASTSATSRS